MRTRSISTATALAVLFGSTVLSVAAARSASAASAVVAVPGGIVADGALKRVFVGDRSAGKVLAADYSGALVDSVSGVSGVSGLALSDDGATLYAAAGGSHEIVALDAATLDVKARYAVATTEGPRYVAFAGGKVWFTYGDQWDGDLGSVDPASETDPVTLGRYPQGYGVWGPALLDTDPSAPGLLAVGETGLSTDAMAIIDVSGATPQPVAWHEGDYTLNNGIGDIDLVPGVSEVLVNGMQRNAYADGKFTAAGSYPSGHRADIAANGLVAQIYGGKVAVYRPNATQPLRTYTTGTSSTAAALTWAPDSSRIFALVGTSGGYTLQTLTDPTLNVPTLTVNAPATAARAKSLTVTGKLSATVPLPSGVPLQVTRTDLESPNGKALPSVTVRADGTYSFTDTPPAGGNVKYAVTYAGDADHTAVSASDTVDVPRSAVTLTVNRNGGVYAYGTAVKFTANLGKTYKNRTLSLYADTAGDDKGKYVVKTGAVDSKGNLPVTLTVRRDTTVSASFSGDARTVAKTATSRVGARVWVSLSVSRYYKKATVSGRTRYYFRKKTNPLFTTTMTPYPGRSQRLQLQVYYNGAWRSSGSQYFALNSAGKSVVQLVGTHQVGYVMRVRPCYHDGASGDAVNATTYGSWRYYTFTS
ncbi:YncE family protein [Actinomadura sp. HBU206391]|uniref:YncE family protein n=1 Tax=Actinomadura sp. HBU206391 TaxID=2731692 RepID=UPI00164FFBEC|nr:Ig-like domain repeat protein [Actinomadura sp. HBU206391]MBC6456600.1 Ig-like domain repeat protein [Actinomadura sp. HBU206391]